MQGGGGRKEVASTEDCVCIKASGVPHRWTSLLSIRFRGLRRISLRRGNTAPWPNGRVGELRIRGFAFGMRLPDPCSNSRDRAVVRLAVRTRGQARKDRGSEPRSHFKASASISSGGLSWLSSLLFSWPLFSRAAFSQASLRLSSSPVWQALFS